MKEIEKIRYILEHELIPKMFYEQKVGMLNSILDKQGKFFSDLYALNSPNGVKRTYSENDFKIEAKNCQYDENKRTLYFLVVTMPEPTMPMLCRRVYFCYEEKTGIGKYYTSERSFDSDYAMCSWSEKHVHENYGIAPVRAEREFQKIGNLFLKYVIAQ